MPNFEFQKREYYGIMQISKWWKYVFHFVVNIATMNSYTLYDQANTLVYISHGNRKPQYRINLMKQLIGNILPCKRVQSKGVYRIQTTYKCKLFNFLVCHATS
jgi:hypothetical protein